MIRDLEMRYRSSWYSQVYDWMADGGHPMLNSGGKAKVGQWTRIVKTEESGPPSGNLLQEKGMLSRANSLRKTHCFKAIWSEK